VTLDAETITKLLQLRDEGHDDLRIADQLGFDIQELIDQDESTIESIDHLVEAGIRDVPEIAKKLNLPPRYIEVLSCDYNLPVVVGKTDLISLLKHREKVRRELKEGKEGKKTKNKRLTKKLKAQQKEVKRIEVLDALAIRGLPLEDMIEPSGLKTKIEVKKYLRATDQYRLWKTHYTERKRIGKGAKGRERKKRGKGTRGRPKTGGAKSRGRPKTGTTRIPEVDRIIAERGTIDEMKKAYGWESDQSARSYMGKTSQYEGWKTGKKELKSEKQQRKNSIGNLIKLPTQQIYQKSDRIEQKVFEFFTKSRSTRPDYKIRTIYTRYFEAKDNEEKQSLAELGRGLDLWYSEIGKILKTVGLEPLRGKRERQVTPKYKKEAIKRVFHSEMNFEDLAYFLEIPNHVVYQNMRRIGARRTFPKYIPQIPAINLTYRLSSQIYEARDLGFETQEIAELLDRKEGIINFALHYEKTIAPKIIETLKMIHPEKDITTPYTSFS
jgi:hypothetical protein